MTIIQAAYHCSITTVAGLIYIPTYGQNHHGPIAALDPRVLPNVVNVHRAIGGNNDPQMVGMVGALLLLGIVIITIVILTVVFITILNYSYTHFYYGLVQEMV